MINKRKRFHSMIILFCLLLLLMGCNHEEDNPNETESVSFVESEEKAEEVEKAEEEGEAERINSESCRELSLVGVVDDYVGAEELSDFFARQDSLEKMVSFNQILNSQFEFYEIYTQSLQSMFYWDMDDSFLETYDGVPIKNQEIEIDGEKCFVSTLNSIEVNANAYYYFFDYIGEGRGFFESDFQYKRNEKIPVILGNDYKSFYSLGDCINLNYLGKDFEYEVIGFFEDGLRMKIENSEYNINQYLCVPYFEYDGNAADDAERAFWQRHYQEKNSGYIKVDNRNGLSEEEIIAFYGSEIQKIAEELELQYNVLAIIYHISTERNNFDVDLPLLNYYHSVSDADTSSVYLGGLGGIYRVNSELEVQTLYSTPNIAGAALYGDYVFSLEYNISDEGMTIDLIRMNKNGSDKETLAQVSSGSYDLRIVDNTLILSEEILGDYGMETVYQAYTLSAEGNLTSDTPKDAYSQFGLPDGYEEGMRFLINPWFSMKYFGHCCFSKAIGETGTNSVWIKKEYQESAEEAAAACSGEPLLAKDKIFYCNGEEEILLQRVLDDGQEVSLYEIPKGNSVSLLTYDAEWIYFLQASGIDESYKYASSIMRVNLQNHRAEEIYKLRAGESISNFNVYGNNSYFILSGAENNSRWECCNLTDFTVTTIH